MPRWTPDLDAILLHAVFEECNISFSKALCTKIAQRIEDKGIECTYKAVENRLYGWKKKNVDTGAATPAKKTATPKKPATPKTPISRPKAAAKKAQKEKTPASDDDNSSESEVLLNSPTAERNKRARGTPKKTYAESDGEDAEEEDEYVPISKKVKMEPVDEVLETYDKEV